MHFGELDIPDVISTALKSGNLVVFVGAGVSKPKPSDLPMFDELAKRIAEGTGMERERRVLPNLDGSSQTVEIEPLDRFLGRMAKGKVEVKQLAKSILVGEHTRANSLHESLIGLFREVDDIRIVTTNFDQHLSTVLTAVHQDQAIEYSAPALPVGSDFTGLVYLHGSAVRDVERCVFTDEDFGRAYLTEGWARRFLVAMFARFTVLFVGYSHNDPVMNYLARGLSPDSRHRRFALVPEGEEAHWHFLDIQPLTYPLRENENRHEALAEGLLKWASHCQQSFLDNVRHVTHYAKDSPPKDPQEQDFMEECFKDADLLRHFVDTCRNAEWLHWIHEKGLLRPLFTPEATLSNCDGLIAWWMTRHLLAANTPMLLRLVQQLGPNMLHPALCNQIHSTLVYLKQEEGVAIVFSTWVVVLLAQPGNRLPPQSWASLLAACGDEKSLLLVGSLFERATELNVIINKHWSFATERSSDDPPVDFDVKIEHEAAYSLDEAWKLVLQPNLQNLAVILEPIVTHRIIQANGILQAVNRASGGYDPLSIGRSSIEPHPQDEYPDDFEYLIDVARDLVASYQEHAPHRAEAIIRTWLDLDVPLLKRLAIHALTRQSTLTPAQKIQLCIEQRALFEMYVRTEVFFLLRQIYSSLAIQEREDLFRAVEAGPTEDQMVRLDDEDKQRMLFEVVGWIAKGAPTCQLATSKLTAQQIAHPDWGLSEHPDLLIWSSGFGFKAAGEGLDFEATLKKPAAEFLQMLVSSPPSGRLEERRDNLCSALPPLMAKDVGWAIDCQRAARELQIHDDDVWQYICMGWRDVKPADEQWASVLTEITSDEAPIAFFNHIPDTLEVWAKRKDDCVPEALWAEMDRLALTCWRVALQNAPPISEPSKDWLSLAINRVGGSYAEYLLLRLEAIRKAGDDKIKGIPEPIRGALCDIVLSDSGSGELGRVIIAAQARWLFAIDSGFAKTEVIPLFDWRVDEKRAEQCWHGFLSWGQWSASLVEQLLPAFTETVRRFASGDKEDSERMGERVAGHLAALCVWFVPDPLAKDWLQSCVRLMGQANRTHFALKLKNQLEELSSEELEKHWQCWLYNYWKARTSGVPSLQAGEATWMFNWAIFPQKHTPEAVSLALASAKVADFTHSSFVHELNESKLVSLYPTEAAELLLAFLKRSPKWFRVGKASKELWKSLVEAKVSASLLEEIRSHLIKLGGNLDDFPQ